MKKTVIAFVGAISIFIIITCIIGMFSNSVLNPNSIESKTIRKEKPLDWEVTYQLGDIDTIQAYKVTWTTTPYDGDCVWIGPGEYLCGVRKFRKL
jgi:hypothetical protein